MRHLRPVLLATLAATTSALAQYGSSSGAPTAPALKVATPTRGDVHRFVTQPGTVRPLQQATLYAWQAGTLEIPATTVKATGPGGAQAEVTEPAASVELITLLGDGIPLTELASDIRGPVSAGGRPWWWWAIAAGAAASALGFTWWLRSRRAPEPAEPPLPPAEWALREMDRLEQDRLAERGEVEGFFVRLSDVVRTYVERRFSIAAPERTTQEFLREASRHPDLRGGHEQALGAFLRSADMVKFAAVRPGAEHCSQALAAMRGFVERTAPPPEEAR